MSSHVLLGYSTDDSTWWDEEQQYGAYDGGIGYYDEYGTYAGGEGEWETFEVDLYSMVFTLDSNLQPQELYEGFEFEEKAFLFVLEASDIDEQSPIAWRSRPLKIHPEPARKDGGPRAANSAVAGGDGEGNGTPTAASVRSGPGSPLLGSNGPATPGLSQGPHFEGLPLAAIASGGREAGAASGAEDTLAFSPKSDPKTPVTVATSTQPAGSPRIVISNSQLEHLKQKMQALKQRRTEPTTNQKDEAQTPTATVATPEEAKKAAEEASPQTQRATPQKGAPIVHSNCPGAHGLKLFQTPEAGWWCSVCENEKPEGANFYSCRTCDYDECERCALSIRTPKSVKGATPSAAKASAKGASTTAPRKQNSSPKASPKRGSKEKSPRKASPRQSSRGTRAASAERSDSPGAASTSPPRREPRKASRREATHEVATPSRHKEVKAGHATTKSRRENHSSRGDKEKEKKKKKKKPAVVTSRRRAHVAEKTKAKAKAAAAASEEEDDEEEEEEESSQEEEEEDDANYRPAARETRRTTIREPRDARLVPQKRRTGSGAQVPEHWEPRERKEKEKQEEPRSPPRDVQRRHRSDAGGSQGGRGQEKTQPRTKVPAKRRLERPAPSRSEEPSSSEEEPLPKKRVANALALSTSEDPVPRETTKVSLTRSSAVSARRSPEPPARTIKAMGNDEGSGLAARTLAAQRRGATSAEPPSRQRQGGKGGGDDFLRKVLRAAGQQRPSRSLIGAALGGAGLTGAGAGIGGAVGAGGSAERSGTAKDGGDSSDRETLPPKPARSEPVARLRPPPNRAGGSAPTQNIRKAFEDFASQGDRKSRRG
mmetsp:Transcript_93375/g.207735  ORF Transcript_93375/g.207735 Transcript_93375/m.207735 type:complete len:827 (+) Transcript_93375:230-2710(+)